MDECNYDSGCVKDTLKSILFAQRKAEHKKERMGDTSCFSKPLNTLINNTIPIILYCDCKPLSIEGVTTCIDEKCKKVKFVCFLTFIFRIVDLEDDCVVLELLKFKNHQQCFSKNDDHQCSLCCQVNCEDVENLVATGVCVKFDLSIFTGIQCLPAMCI